MPMPKITDLKHINIGADGVGNQEGRTPKTLAIRVVKVEDAQIDMVKLAEAKKLTEEAKKLTEEAASNPEPASKDAKKDRKSKKRGD